jgi:hypothetical protein
MLIPENKIVNVHSDLASFEGTGFFKSLNVSLSQGNCKLHNFNGDGIFHTLKGDIIIQAHPEVTGVAISEYGTVSNSLRIHQKYDIAAQSKHGNIDLTQIKY